MIKYVVIHSYTYIYIYIHVYAYMCDMYTVGSALYNHMLK